jgi:hypothetical protein
MKKSIVMFVFAMAALSFVSCKEEAKEETTEEMQMASYVCPMDCEKGKTYEAAGKCPVCEMDLVAFEDAHEGHDHENHEGHNH